MGRDSWAQRIVAWDHALSRRCQRITGKGARRWAVLGAHLGDGWVWMSILALALVLITPSRRYLVWRWALAMIVAGGIATTLKFLWHRQRPLQVDGFYSTSYDRHSFPSGHATRMGTAIIFVPDVLPGWGWFILPIALWVCWARVALGIHYLLDMVVGVVLGFVISAVIFSV
ncbi:MAG: phosphatase PAP2 family protein [Anaerolineae bacterium]|nr:phosphatase PAP2 family protein [Anaerolineae bacterium]